MSNETLGIAFIIAGVMAGGGGIAAVMVNRDYWDTRWLIWGATLALEFVGLAVGVTLLAGPLIGIGAAAAVAAGDATALAFLQRSLATRHGAG